MELNVFRIVIFCVWVVVFFFFFFLREVDAPEGAGQLLVLRAEDYIA